MSDYARPAVAITGANGYVGSTLSAAFTAAGYRVIAMQRSAPTVVGRCDYLPYSLQDGPAAPLPGDVAAIVERRGARVRRTRYREAHWSTADTAVAVASLLASAATLSTQSRAPAALRYEPYPVLTLPAVDMVLLAGLGLLLVPVWFAQSARNGTC